MPRAKSHVPQQPTAGRLTEDEARALLAEATHPEEAEIALAMVVEWGDVVRAELEAGSPVLYTADGQEFSFRREVGATAAMIAAITAPNTQTHIPQSAGAPTSTKRAAA